MKAEKKILPRLPQAINLYITYRCNSRCAHCFLVQNDLLNKHEIDKDRIFSMIDEMERHNVYMLIISGGEPLLHPNFFEIVKYADERHILPLIAITGTRVSDETIINYASAGIPTVQMSLDAPSASLNNNIRNRGDYLDTMSSITRFQAAGVNVNLAICLHRDNYAYFGEFLALCHQWKIFRVKLGIYARFAFDTTVRELDPHQVARVLHVAREFILSRKLDANWITSPTVDIWTGERILHRSGLPPLTVGAEGVLTSGDGGPVIGSLNSGSLSEQYAIYVDQKIERFFEIELQAAFAEHSIDSVTEVQSLDANALIYRTNNRFVIYANPDLPRPLKFFTLLHEIGHVATNTLRSLPRSARSDYDERSANVWALNRVKPHLRADAFDMYLSAANHSEGLLYERISQFLENDLIGYY